jgi:hypothetical protein
MINAQIVELKGDGNDVFDVEITGSLAAETALILVHGFGVKRNSRGLFTDIEGRLSSRLFSVRGDFSEVTSFGTKAIPLSMQALRLEQIKNYLDQKTKVCKYIYLGHSQGCIVVAKAKPVNSRVILLAPPIAQPAADRFAATPGWLRPGSVLNMKGTSILQRSDGSITKVGADYWDDFKEVNPEALYSDLARNNQVNVILAGSDNVLGQQKPLGGIPSDTVVGADHDFSGSAREVLIQKVVSLLKLN